MSEHEEYRQGSFQYRSLPDKGTHIRLLRFRAGNVEPNELHCELVVFEITDTPAYVAISYTWGSSLLEATVHIEDRIKFVRRNCYDALKQIREHTESLGIEYVWIDSLCINQDDIGEKNAQVQLMGSIFARAHYVCACIGPEADESALVMETLATLKPELEAHLGSILSMAPEDAELWLFSRIDEHTFEDVEKARMLIAKREFWERLWILPELFISHKPLLLCGSHLVEWSVLDRYMLLMAHIRKKRGSKPEKDSGLLKVWRAKRTTSSRITRSELLHLVTGFREWKCFDCRDRLYAFLHMVDWPSKAVMLTPDYNKSRLQVALDFIRWMCVEDDPRIDGLWYKLSLVSSVFELATLETITELHDWSLDMLSTAIQSAIATPETLVNSEVIAKMHREARESIGRPRISVKLFKRDLIPLHHRDNGDLFVYLRRRRGPTANTVSPITIHRRKSYRRSCVRSQVVAGDFLTPIDGTLCLVIRHIQEELYEVIGHAHLSSLPDWPEAERPMPSKLDEKGVVRFDDVGFAILAAPILFGRDFAYKESDLRTLTSRPPWYVYLTRDYSGRV